MDPPGSSAPDAEGAPADFLAALAAAAREAEPAARRLLASLEAPDVMAQRDIWLSWAPLDRREEVLATAAYLGGWAVFREPGAAIHPATFVWARPTIASGDAAALAAFAESLAAIGPRWGRGRWLRRRAARLRAWIVTGEAPSAEIAQLLQRLAPAARILPLPEAGW